MFILIPPIQQNKQHPSTNNKIPVQIGFHSRRPHTMYYDFITKMSDNINMGNIIHFVSGSVDACS